MFPGEDEKRRGEIVELGLKYSLLTRYTSFVAVDELVRNANPDAARNIKQPLPLPQGVSELAVGGGLRPMPEPELLWLALLTALIVCGRRIRLLRTRATA